MIRTSFFRGKYGWRFGLRWVGLEVFLRDFPLPDPEDHQVDQQEHLAIEHMGHMGITGWEPHGPCWQKNLAVASNHSTEIIPVSGNYEKLILSFKFQVFIAKPVDPAEIDRTNL